MTDEAGPDAGGVVGDGWAPEGDESVGVLSVALGKWFVAFGGGTGLGEIAIESEEGMVGAGGIGFVIANSIQNYECGTAGSAILLVFLLATAIERAFVFLKRRLR